MKTLLREVTDAIGLDLKTAHELCLEYRAKSLSAQKVNQKYRKLASEEIQFTEFSYGNGYKSVLSATDSSSKLRLNMTQSYRAWIFFPSQTKLGGRRGGTDTRSWPRQPDVDPDPQREQGSRTKSQRSMDSEECIDDATIDVGER